MRGFILLGLLTLWCAPADAVTIVQTITGTLNNPGTINGFDPITGYPTDVATLVSVQVEGTINASFSVLRTNTLDLSAANYPGSASGTLSLSPGTTFASFDLSGTESYADGSVGGAMSFSGPIFTILTGSDVTKFFGGHLLVIPSVTPSFPTGGSIARGSSVNYALTVTYNYILTPLPEASTWAMMLLGFGAIGIAMRQRHRLFSQAA